MTGGLSQKINSNICNPKKLEVFKKQIEILDNALQKGYMTHNVILYRWTDVRFLKSYTGKTISIEQVVSLIGKTVINDIYTSTSFENLKLLGRNTEMKILVPKGTKNVLYIKELALDQFKYQDEVLFGRGLKYRFIDAKIEEGIVKLVVEVQND